MLVFTLQQSPLVGEDCEICFEAFEIGQHVARLPCFCFCKPYSLSFFLSPKNLLQITRLASLRGTPEGTAALFMGDRLDRFSNMTCETMSPFLALRLLSNPLPRSFCLSSGTSTCQVRCLLPTSTALAHSSHAVMSSPTESAGTSSSLPPSGKRSRSSAFDDDEFASPPPAKGMS